MFSYIRGINLTKISVNVRIEEERKVKSVKKMSKYDMYVNASYTRGLSIPISKKEFLRQIDYYKKDEDIVSDSNDHCRMVVTSTERDEYIETLYAVIDDETTIVFRERTCKPGFCFKK